MKEIILIAHNIRSTHNIGSIFRTAEGFGIQKIIFSGYTPYPEIPNDPRLPHIRQKLTKDIHKTALGAETMVQFAHSENILNTIKRLKSQNYAVLALEQATNSLKLQNLNKVNLGSKIALILGEEVNGIPPEILKTADFTVEIPMYGQKESFNVSVAAGIALYKLSVELSTR